MHTSASLSPQAGLRAADSGLSGKKRPSRTEYEASQVTRSVHYGWEFQQVDASFPWGGRPQLVGLGLTRWNRVRSPGAPARIVPIPPWPEGGDVTDNGHIFFPCGRTTNEQYTHPGKDIDLSSLPNKIYLHLAFFEHLLGFNILT